MSMGTEEDGTCAMPVKRYIRSMIFIRFENKTTNRAKDIGDNPSKCFSNW